MRELISETSHERMWREDDGTVTLQRAEQWAQVIRIGINNPDHVKERAQELVLEEAMDAALLLTDEELISKEVTPWERDERIDEETGEPYEFLVSYAYVAYWPKMAEES